MQSRHNLNILRFILSGDKAMAHKEVQQDQCAIRLKFTLSQMRLDFLSSPKIEGLDFRIVGRWMNICAYLHVVYELTLWLQEAALAARLLIANMNVGHGAASFSFRPHDILGKRGFFRCLSYQALKWSLR